jgi:hypothetical protein
LPSSKSPSLRQEVQPALKYLEVPPRLYEELYKAKLDTREKEKTRLNADKLRSQQTGRGGLFELVGIWLLHLAWKAGKLTFPLPNGRLEAHGISRKVKRAVLHKLEAAGLIKVDRRRGKSPLITLLHL